MAKLNCQENAESTKNRALPFKTASGENTRSGNALTMISVSQKGKYVKWVLNKKTPSWRLGTQGHNALTAASKDGINTNIAWQS
ncbi:MAG: hypothetical protein IKT57_03855 [Clostridia bacterium]|nr:hypothetical protein [Clostridia bacterium]